MKILRTLICASLLVAVLGGCEKINLNRLEGTWAEQYDPTVFAMDGSLEFTFDGNGKYQLHTYDALSGKTEDHSGGYLLDAEYIEEKNPVIVSVNFITKYSLDSRLKRNTYLFFGSRRRYREMKQQIIPEKTIVTSNVPTGDIDNEFVVDYSSLIDRQYKFYENSTMMLLRLLKKLEASDIALAGFDGFDAAKEDNYAGKIFQNDRHIEEFDEMTKEVTKMLKELRKSLSGKAEIHFVTPSLYEK